jgi:hypothetical protein
VEQPKKVAAKKRSTPQRAALASGGGAISVEAITLKPASWSGKDKEVSASKPDSTRYFSSTYMYFARCVRKALDKNTASDAYIHITDEEKVTSAMADFAAPPNFETMQDAKKNIRYLNHHYKTLWASEAVKAKFQRAFEKKRRDDPFCINHGCPAGCKCHRRAQREMRQQKPTPTKQQQKKTTTTTKKKKKKKKTTTKKKTTKEAPAADTSPAKAKKTPAKGGYWKFSKDEHASVKEALKADGKNPSGKDIAKEKGRRWRGLSATAKDKYAA